MLNEKISYHFFHDVGLIAASFIDLHPDTPLKGTVQFFGNQEFHLGKSRLARCPFPGCGLLNHTG